MIYVNGAEQPDAASVTDLLERLGLGAQPRGVAVALDGEVLPRARWQSQALRPGMRVEVVGAIQGG
ncbi:MAG: sulfur carrier protein ThiS [Solirubrobacteraceae bacterium]|jgi:sulfur carrier protein